MRGEFRQSRRMSSYPPRNPNFAGCSFGICSFLPLFACERFLKCRSTALSRAVIALSLDEDLACQSPSSVIMAHTSRKISSEIPALVLIVSAISSINSDLATSLPA